MSNEISASRFRGRREPGAGFRRVDRRAAGARPSPSAGPPCSSYLAARLRRATSRRSRQHAARLDARGDHARRRAPGARRFPRSNARLVREALLRNHATAATFTPLATSRLPRTRNSSPRARASPIFRFPQTSSSSAWATTATRRRGFPAPKGCRRRWIPARGNSLRRFRRPTRLEPRLTLTGRVILRARTIALLIEGQDKLKRSPRALEDGPAEAMPIRTVLRGASDRLTIFAAQRA